MRKVCSRPNRSGYVGQRTVSRVHRQSGLRSILQYPRVRERVEHIRAVPGLCGSPPSHLSTNAVKPINTRYRRAVRPVGISHNEQAALKCLYLGTRPPDRRRLIAWLP